jgi:putative transposase
MILTYKIRHNRDFSKELKQAFKIAEFVVNIPDFKFSRYSFPGGRFNTYEHKRKRKCRSSKDVKDFKLPSAISNQILKKYGSQKNIKEVHNVNLIVPNQSIKLNRNAHTITITPLKLTLNYQFPEDFQKVNQIELDSIYAYISCTVPEIPEVIPYEAIMGVDRNTTGHIAVSANLNTGQVRMMGKKAFHVHKKYKNIRRKLQKNGKFRKVKRMKDRESRIVKDLNHKISRKLVETAKDQHAVLVFEDLSGIRNTKKQHHSFKHALHSWSFYQLQTFVEYKAKLLGVSYVYVDPAYTSKDCSRCGARGQRYKKNFKCPVCGHVNHADVNAAFNIALRQKDVIARMQTMMCTMGALIPHDDALLERENRLEPHDFSHG